MSKNVFFENSGPFLLSKFFDINTSNKKIKIFDIKSLEEAENTDLTFLESSILNVALYLNYGI